MSDLMVKLNRALVLLESNQQQSRILDQLQTLSKAEGIAVTIIGGMAVNEYGYARYTADIDILISQPDAIKLANKLLNVGWIDLGGNKLQDISGVVLNFCATGIKADKGIVFPPPENTEPGISMASLPLLLTLKILANRSKDRADVVELIKRNKLSQEYINDEIVPRLKNKMDQKMALVLWDTAQKEMDE